MPKTAMVPRNPPRLYVATTDATNDTMTNNERNLIFQLRVDMN
ncbi:MAG: hypothetical protein M5R36_03490 [Deltaproteobacteria bacterium]|nr:hypothetical protein [Deltaproteobacteria bacterium]